MALRIELAVGWQGKGAEAGDADLTAVGVAGEDEIDMLSAGVGEDRVGEVGLVRHEQDGCVGLLGHCKGEVRRAPGVVVDAAEKDVLVAAFDANVLVDEEGKTVMLEVVADDAWADEDVMIAEDAVSLRAGEGAEEFRASCGGLERDVEGLWPIADEVAGDEDEVWIKRVDFLYDAAKEEIFGVLLEVNVGELNETESVEGRGKLREVEGAEGSFDGVAAVFVAVERDASSGDG